MGDRRYLYTTGYVPSLGRSPHVPTPVQITGHVGDSSAKALLAEVLLMTKMNWNSAAFGGLCKVVAADCVVTPIPSIRRVVAAAIQGVARLGAPCFGHCG